MAIPFRRDPTVAPRPGESPSSASRLVPDSHSVDPADGRRRQGKAPPIEFFSGEDFSILLDDWLPSLERAATWNGWTPEDKLMQLPGYLKDRALQGWRLLPRSEQQSYLAEIEALRTRLDPGSKTVAAQQFRHSLQKSGECVSDFIRRLEKKYQIAYSRDDLNTATRDALLCGQLYEGLRYEIMLSPAVSGSQGYKELATAAKAEARRLAALKQRQSYSKVPGNNNPTSTPPSTPTGNQSTSRDLGKNAPSGPSSGKDTRRCYNCGETGHYCSVQTSP